jgi:hypothetical protein
LRFRINLFAQFYRVLKAGIQRQQKQGNQSGDHNTQDDS